MARKRFLSAVQHILNMTTYAQISAGTNIIVAAEQGKSQRRAHADGYESTCFLLHDSDLVDVVPRDSEQDEGKGSGQGNGNTITLTVLVRRRHLERLLLSLAPSSSHLLRSVVEDATRGATCPWINIRPDDADMLWDIVEILVIAYSERQTDWEVEVDALVVAYHVIMDRSVAPEGHHAPADVVVSLILDDISTHPDSVTLTELAERYSYNPSYLSSLLRRKTGRTFSELVNAQRMNRAALLLQEPNASVRAVASLVGYSSVSSFHRQFRSFFGITPSQMMQGDTAT